MLKKYAKCTSFDQLDFESFAAGETRIILSIMDSIDLGEEDWETDFSHYETMVPTVQTLSPTNTTEK